jgi:hypothetical protein
MKGDQGRPETRYSGEVARRASIIRKNDVTCRFRLRAWVTGSS